MSATAEFRRLSVLSSRVWKHWKPTILVFSAATTVVGLYFSDWKVTNTKIPFYRRKFDDEGNLMLGVPSTRLYESEMFVDYRVLIAAYSTV